MKKILFTIPTLLFVLICVLSIFIMINKKPAEEKSSNLIIINKIQDTIPKEHFFAPTSTTLMYSIMFVSVFLAITLLGYSFTKAIFDFTKIKNVLITLFSIRIFLIVIYIQAIILFYLFCSAYTMLDLTSNINRVLDLITGILLMILYVPYYVASLTNLVFPILFLVVGFFSLIYLKNNNKDFYAIMYGFNSIVLLIILNFFVIDRFIA